MIILFVWEAISALRRSGMSIRLFFFSILMALRQSWMSYPVLNARLLIFSQLFKGGNAPTRMGWIVRLTHLPYHYSSVDGPLHPPAHFTAISMSHSPSLGPGGGALLLESPYLAARLTPHSEGRYRAVPSTNSCNVCYICTYVPYMHILPPDPAPPHVLTPDASAGVYVAAFASVRPDARIL